MATLPMVTSQQISNWTPFSAAILEVSIDSEKISNPYLECLESHSRRTRIDSSSSYAKMISMPMSVRNPQETITQQTFKIRCQKLTRQYSLWENSEIAYS